MTRDMFIKVASKALRNSAGRSPEEQAEAVASLMELVTGLVEDESPQKLQDPQPSQIPWPAMPPGAVTAAEPQPEERQAALEPSLIIPATSIPDKVERAQVQPAPPVTLRAIPRERLKVEDLSRLIQERTPDRMVVDVPMPDGGSRKAVFVRNVISMHAHDCVQLVYSPPGALPSAREAAEVMTVLHIDEIPFDLPKILKSLEQQAIKAITPRAGGIVSVTPPVNVGPVMHPGDGYRDPSGVAGVQAVFGSLG